MTDHATNDRQRWITSEQPTTRRKNTMTNKCEDILDEMTDSGDSQALAVADCLRTIAENDEDQAKDTYLIECAKEIKGWADFFIKEMKNKKRRRTTSECTRVVYL
jgi:hypothetical protein